MPRKLSPAQASILGAAGGKVGGKSRSRRKVRAARRNLAKATAKLRNPAITELSERLGISRKAAQWRLRYGSKLPAQ
jgi:hypothetical protein